MYISALYILFAPGSYTSHWLMFFVVNTTGNKAYLILSYVILSYSNGLAMELHVSCTNPLIWFPCMIFDISFHFPVLFLCTHSDMFANYAFLPFRIQKPFYICLSPITNTTKWNSFAVEVWWNCERQFSGRLPFSKDTLWCIDIMNWGWKDGLFGERYGDITMSAMASKITYLRIVYSIVYSGADQRKHQSSASLATV